MRKLIFKYVSSWIEQFTYMKIMSFNLTYYIMYTLLFQWHKQYQTMDAQFCYKDCKYEKADQVCNETKRYHHILNVLSLAIRATIHQTIVFLPTERLPDMHHREDKHRVVLRLTGTDRSQHNSTIHVAHTRPQVTAVLCGVVKFRPHNALGFWCAKLEYGYRSTYGSNKYQWYTMHRHFYSYIHFFLPIGISPYRKC